MSQGNERRDELARLTAEIDQVEAAIDENGRILDDLAVQSEGGPEAERRFCDALRAAEEEADETYGQLPDAGTGADA